MEKYSIEEVFTPTSPAKLNFVERQDINKRIVRALKLKGNQLVVYGHSGSGKTTLIENKLFQIYEHHVRTNCMKGDSYEAVLLDAFDQLSPFYEEASTQSQNQQISANIQTNFALIKSQISENNVEASSSTKKRVLPPQLTAQSLARFMGESKSCWVLEDFHKLDKSEKVKLSQLMKVFMDMSSEYSELKIVFVGAVDSAREVVQYDKEMKRRVSEIHVPLMSTEEISTIMKTGFSLLNIGVKDGELAHDLYDQCSGMPSICHKLCYLMCEDLDVYETLDLPSLFKPSDFSASEDNDEATVRKLSSISGDSLDEDFDEESSCIEQLVDSKSGVYVEFSNLKYALNEYLEEMSDTLKCAFDRALKGSCSEEIIESISYCDRDGGTKGHISDNLKDINMKCSQSLQSKLEKLCTEAKGGILRYLPDSDKYCFADPFYRTYALALNEKRLSQDGSISDREMIKIFNNAMKTIMQRSLSDK